MFSPTLFDVLVSFLISVILGAGPILTTCPVFGDHHTQWFHVIAVDKLGQGYTDNPEADDEHTMSAVVRHSLRFLQKLKMGNLNVVGHSRGRYLVARLALEHPEIIRSCTLIDSNTLAPGQGKNAEVMKNPLRPRFTKERQRWSLERYSFGYSHIS